MIRIFKKRFRRKDFTASIRAGGLALLLAPLAATALAADGAADGAAAGEGLEKAEMRWVSAEACATLDSRYLSYGFVDNIDPILTPAAGLTLFDHLTLQVESIFDVTRYGRRAGYGNREWKYTELHPGAAFCWTFDADECHLPTTVELMIDYQYEYHPAAKARHGVRNARADNDTQFWTATVSLPDLWFEPTFVYERDVIRDDGTYLNLSVGHVLPLVEGATASEDGGLSLRPSFAQGFGNAPRIRAYANTAHGEPLDHAGLMDSRVQCDLIWHVSERVTVSAYVAYSDFLFDAHVRGGARRHEATGEWTHSWSFLGGLAVSVSF